MTSGLVVLLSVFSKTLSEFLKNDSMCLMKSLCFILSRLLKYELGCELRDSMKLNLTRHS